MTRRRPPRDCSADEEAARAVRWDCIQLFGADLWWCDLASLEPEGHA
jgi:hypothetical protein